MNKAADTWLILGLGNPGAEYVGTRHNAGFMAADAVASEIRANYWKNECGSLVAQNSYEDYDVIIAKPQSFMNLSGVPCAQLMKKYAISPNHLIVLHDDLDIPASTIRVKDGGGHGGHNGIRSIIDKLQTNDFLRIKIGIGRPPGRMPVTDYVLTRPRGKDSEELEIGIVKACEATLYLIDNSIADAQQKFN